MRRAAAQPGAEPKVRQNLALVVGLQGRFQEAENIARAIFRPDEAAANVAYLAPDAGAAERLEKEQAQLAARADHRLLIERSIAATSA